jgi:sulfite exporter TauE/SafE
MLTTALIMGFAGSLHCVGMCSPLVMAVTAVKRAALFYKLLYNAGRILTYSFFGVLVSSLGAVLPFSGFQNLFSILLGLTLLVVGFSGTNRLNVPLLTRNLQGLTNFLKIKFGKVYQRKTYLSIFILGTINGVLPCGLTFIALTYCLTLTSPADGFMFMLVFGIGTLPAMIGLPSLLNLMVRKLNLNLSRVTATLLIVSGSLLVARVFFTTIVHAESIQDGVDIVLCR